MQRLTPQDKAIPLASETADHIEMAIVAINAAAFANRALAEGTIGQPNVEEAKAKYLEAAKHLCAGIEALGRAIALMDQSKA